LGLALAARLKAIDVAIAHVFKKQRANMVLLRMMMAPNELACRLRHALRRNEEQRGDDPIALRFGCESSSPD
jgi:hypothetical protein